MIYCVEDDKNIQELVVYTLKQTGFDAIGFSDGNALMENLDKEIPELIMLDIMLPGKDGLEILKDLKSDNKTKDIPIIMLTAKGTEYDKVIGLDSGADDYITKPFGMMELISRIKAVLRRNKPEEKKQNIIACANVTMDLNSHTVEVNDEKISLTLKEYELLKKLLLNQGIVLTREKLLEEIWGYDYYGETRTVDVHIRTLRSKLGNDCNIIETIRGVGYKVQN